MTRRFSLALSRRWEENAKARAMKQWHTSVLQANSGKTIEGRAFRSGRDTGLFAADNAEREISRVFEVGKYC